MSMSFLNLCINNKLAEAQSLYEAGGVDVNERVRNESGYFVNDCMQAALNNRNTELIRYLLSIGFDLNTCPLNSSGDPMPAFYLEQAIKSFCFHSKPDELMSVFPLLLEGTNRLNGSMLDEFKYINAGAYTEPIISLLVAHTDDINRQDRGGYTMLHRALRSFKNAVWVNALLKHPEIDVDLMDYEDRPPLYYACKQATAAVVKELLRKDANPFVLCGKEGTPLLLVACESGDTEIVKALLEAGADIQATDNESRTALHLACRRGDADQGQLLRNYGSAPAGGNKPACNAAMVEFLLENGANPLAMDQEGNMPLHLLVKQRDAETIRCIDLLIAKGADVNAVNNQMRTPFFVSSCVTNGQFVNPNMELLKYLIARGGYADTQDIRQNTPLHYAVEDDDLRRVQFLLEQGADANVKNEQGVSPYKLALTKNRRAVISTIEKAQISLKVNPDELDATFLEACKTGKRGIAEMLIKGSDVDITYVDDAGRTSLHYVAKAGLLALTNLLINKGVDVNYTDRFNQTALHFAAANRQKEVFKLLLDNGADVSIADEDGLLPVHYVASRGQYDILQFLITGGYDIQALTHEGDSVLHLACYNRNKEVVRMLLENGLNPDSQNNDGITSLAYSVCKNQKEIVKMLMEGGASLSSMDKEGNQPIHMAVSHGFKDMAELLIQSGAEVDALNNKGFSSLHMAAIHGRKDMFRFLLEQGADFELKTSGGKSCIDFATENGQKELIELIAIYQRRREVMNE